MSSKRKDANQNRIHEELSDSEFDLYVIRRRITAMQKLQNSMSAIITKYTDLDDRSSKESLIVTNTEDLGSPGRFYTLTDDDSDLRPVSSNDFNNKRKNENDYRYSLSNGKNDQVNTAKDETDFADHLERKRRKRNDSTENDMTLRRNKVRRKILQPSVADEEESLRQERKAKRSLDLLVPPCQLEQLGSRKSVMEVIEDLGPNVTERRARVTSDDMPLAWFKRNGFKRPLNLDVIGTKEEELTDSSEFGSSDEESRSSAEEMSPNSSASANSSSLMYYNSNDEGLFPF